MKDNKQSIPYIKFLIAGSLVVFLSSLVYINYFREEKTLELQKPVKPGEERLKDQALREFNEYIHSRPAISEKKAYTGNAFLKLQETVKALAAQTGYKFAYSDMVLTQADANLMTNAASVKDRGYQLRHAAIVLASSLHKIQQAKYPASYAEAQQLVELSTGFKETDGEQEQDEKAQNFFLTAAELLKKMD